MSNQPHPVAEPAARDATALDATDELASFRSRFAHDDAGVVYLDGNSLGRPPEAVAEAIKSVVEQQWRHELIRGWDHWVDLPTRAGDALAETVLGARPGEVLVADSTSVNLYKLAAAGLAAAGPGRKVLITDDDNFPTDRYILSGVAQQFGGELRVVHTDIDNGVNTDDIAAAAGDDTAVVCLSHVSYRSGALADMAAVTAAVHEAGALMLWDLCHSAGAVPIDLTGCGVDLAVGCTYKYLNAGPGSPAFLYVREQLRPRLRQPLWGWFSQADQFAMGTQYTPKDDIGQFAVGTPPIMGIAAVEAAVSVTAQAGMDALRRKSLRLGQYAVELFDAWLAPLDFALASPRQSTARGGHLTLTHPDAWQIAQAMRDEGVIPDYREPDRLRLGFAPLYNSFTDIFQGLSRVRDIVATGQYRQYPAQRGRVT